MNADQKWRVKFEAETNYNKGFRLTRRNCMGSAQHLPRRHKGTEKNNKSEESLPPETRRRQAGDF
jgi:hypothetical protein